MEQSFQQYNLSNNASNNAGNDPVLNNFNNSQYNGGVNQTNIPNYNGYSTNQGASIPSVNGYNPNIQSSIFGQQPQQPAIQPNVQPQQPTMTDNTIPTQPIVEPIQPQVTAEVNNQPVAQPAQPKVSEVKVYQDYTVPASLFKTAVRTVAIIANSNPSVLISTVMDVTLSPEGIVIKGTDISNTIIYKLDKVKYANTLNFIVEADKLNSLLSKVSDDDIIKIQPSQNNCLSLFTSCGEFIFPEAGSPMQGEKLEVVVTSDPANTNPETIDFNLFKSKIATSKTFVASAKVNERVSGIFLSDKIYASDNFNAYGEDNIPQLVDHSFVLTATAVNIIKEIQFLAEDGEVKMALHKTESGDITAMYLYNNSIELSLTINTASANFPITDVLNILKLTFTNKIILDRVKVKSLLDQVSVFIVPGTDEDCATFSVGPDGLSIGSNNGRAGTIFKESSSQIALSDFKININKMIAALSCLTSEKVTMEIGSQTGTAVILEEPGKRIIVSMRDEDSKKV